ncbi:trem-like transcript 1 protein isoform X2 [Equus przewalskii]|uniref:Triggering receptor expressed on myeloid cells like 1 n=2 Tax=Equus TaxID=9789 RepID=F6RCZ8_HORSE|nr:trem-like transcript 1 protein isoform X2 [Equus caballus]XP_008525299.1 PREDICTED: trem-like transcript 1 protein [Equus przewalskii]
MGPHLLLLLLPGLAGQGSADSLPEKLQAPVGGSILVQCHYRPQDIKARKVWCRFGPEGCQPLVTSAVDRRAPGHRRTFLTDMGSGLLQVEMVTLREEDVGEYGCVVEGTAGPQTVHRVALEVLPAAPGLGGEEEENYKAGSLADGPSSDPAGRASPPEPSQDKSIPLIWGAVLLLALLVAAAVLFAVMAKRKGNRRGACGRFQNSGVPGTTPSSVVHHISDSELAVSLPSDVPYVRLDSPPSFDNTTYTSLPLDPPSGKSPLPAPSSLPALPPKVLTCSKPVTYATVIFPGGDQGGEASCEPAQDLPNSQTPPS